MQNEVELGKHLACTVFFFGHLKGFVDSTLQQVNPIQGQAMLGGNFETLQETSIPAIETLPKGFYQDQLNRPKPNVGLLVSYLTSGTFRVSSIEFGRKWYTPGLYGVLLTHFLV